MTTISELFSKKSKVIHAFLEVLLQCVDVNVHACGLASTEDVWTSLDQLFRTEAQSGWIVGMHKMGFFVAS